MSPNPNPPLIQPGHSVALIGNGPSLLGSGLKNLIDGYDEVIRCNGFALKGYEEDVGTKATIWATAGEKIVPYDGVFPDKILYIHGSNGRPGCEGRQLWRVPRTAYDAARLEVQVESTRLPVSSRLRLLPTLGYVVARWLVEECQIPCVDLFGFDHFSKTEMKQHHYWTPGSHSQPNEHDGSAEARLFARMAEADRVRYVTTSRKGGGK